MNDFYFQVVYYHLTEDNPEGRRVCSHKCANPAAMVLFLHICKNIDVEFWPRKDDEQIAEDISEEFGNIPAYVDSFNISFGSDDSIQLIEVYLR